MNKRNARPANPACPLGAAVVVVIVVVLAGVAATTGCTPPRKPFALRRVVLFQNGIGYFEHRGVSSRDRVRLAVRAHEVDDVLKTLTVIDESGKRQAVSAVTRGRADGAKKAKGAKAAVRTIELRFDGARARRLRVSYAVPTPAWKPTYRLVLGGDGGGSGKRRAVLQGWAMINNTSGDSWRRVRLTLATGAPMSYAMDMRTPRFVARPDLRGRLHRPIYTGAVHATRLHARPGDRDGDGIPDAKDRCPDLPEDKDGFEDTDGCPDPDNDQDGIADSTDRCPNEPETRNGYADADGCPDKGRVVVRKGNIAVLDRIYFRSRASLIQRVSLPILRAIAATLKGNPQITAVEVAGHADASESDPWGTSSRRANAVRAKLQALGVRTRLVAVAYGATRPVSTQRTSAGRSRNRRVAFRILARKSSTASRSGSAGAAKGALGSVTARAAQTTIAAGALPRSVAGLTRYALPGRATIQRNRPTLVAVINESVRSGEVLLYQPTSKVRGSDRHPLRAAFIANSSRLTLEPGPIAVFARGTFVGEGLLARIHPNERAYIPFALDDATTVRKTVARALTPSRLVALVDGVLTVEDRRERLTRYHIVAGARSPRRLVIRHRRTSGMRAVGLPPGSERRGDALLLPLPITPGARSTLLVRERRPLQRTIRLVSCSPDQLELYIQGGAGKLPPALAKGLSRVVALRRQSARLARRVRRARRRLADISARADQIRRSIKVIAKARGAARVRRRLMAHLDKVTRELATTAESITTAGAKRTTVAERLRQTVAKLTLREQRPKKAKAKAKVKATS